MALLRAPSNEADQKGGETFKENSLSDDQQDRERCICIAAMNFELVQPLPEQIQHQEKIRDDKNRVDCQLNDKSAQGSSGSFFHKAEMVK
jgi:hypothetical protein